jgi:uncharacterized membrane protein
MATLMTRADRVAPWRFLLFFALLLLGWAIAPFALKPAPALLVGFDIAATAFLVSCISTLRHEADDMRSLAERSDANRGVLLILSCVLGIVVLVALVDELGVRGALGLAHKALIFGSLVLAWTFGNAVYTLHYAHLYYRRNDAGTDSEGLQFPGPAEPLMSDFAYFSFTIGAAVQTSDVQITSREIRKVVTAHAVIGFFFNLGALALAINVLGSR